MAEYHDFGPGTVTIGAAPEVDFTCEVLSFEVSHDYTEVGTARTTLCGELRGSRTTRADSVKFGLEEDLTAAGFYAYAQTANPNVAVPLTFTPNTVDGATWEGDVYPRLPNVKADEYGAPISGDVTLPAVDVLVFTPAAVAP